MAHVEEGAAREQTEALCRRVTELGYGLDGPAPLCVVTGVAFVTHCRAHRKSGNSVFRT